MSQVVNQAGAYPGFCSTKRLRVLIFYFPLDGMLVHRRVTSSIKFTGTHLYIWVERGPRTRHNVLGQCSNLDRPIWS